MNKVILIGGSPTAGKSYTARKLAEQLKLPWISTDTIRESMRQIVRKEEYPYLFNHLQFLGKGGAVKFLTQKTSEEIVNHQNEESIDVWKGVKALIETDYVWEYFIIEGAAILPHLVSSLVKKNKNIKAVFLIDENLARVRKTIFTRGLWGEANEYPDSVKEKEVEWINLFNNYIKREAKKYNLPVVSIGNRKNHLSEVKRLIK